MYIRYVQNIFSNVTKFTGKIACKLSHKTTIFMHYVQKKKKIGTKYIGFC
jgi:hypothetical protein